jgi:hypothetical protein
MSNGAIKAWRTTVTPELLELARQQIDPKHRPTIVSMELVGLYLAVAQRQHKSYCDEAHTQIAAGLHNVLSIDQVKNALRALDHQGLWQIVKLGGKNAPTRRVLSCFDPDGLIKSQGAIPPHDAEQSQGDKTTTQGDKTLIAGGRNTQHSGTNPPTPKSLPNEIPNYSPRYPSKHNAQAL